LMNILFWTRKSFVFERWQALRPRTYQKVSLTSV